MDSTQTSNSSTKRGDAMKLLSIDPGNTHSAWMVYDTEAEKPVRFGILDNATLLENILSTTPDRKFHDPVHMAIEMVASYGMSVGKEVFETVYWIGRFVQARCPQATTRVYRREVKMHLCGCNNAKDANVRQALIDRFGPGKAKAVGTKKAPGPLYGISKDAWSALAIAVTFSDRLKKDGL